MLGCLENLDGLGAPIAVMLLVAESRQHLLAGESVGDEHHPTFGAGDEDTTVGYRGNLQLQQIFSLVHRMSFAQMRERASACISPQRPPHASHYSGQRVLNPSSFLRMWTNLRLLPQLNSRAETP